MFDIAWTEMLVIALITIVVVGPRDLPKVMKTVGSFVGKIRSFTHKFQSDMDALARETELDDLRKQARAYQATLQNPTRALDKAIDPETGEEIRKGIDVSSLTVGGGGKPVGMHSIAEQAVAPASVNAMAADASKEADAPLSSAGTDERSNRTMSETEPAPVDVQPDEDQPKTTGRDDKDSHGDNKNVPGTATEKSEA